MFFLHAKEARIVLCTTLSFFLYYKGFCMSCILHRLNSLIMALCNDLTWKGPSVIIRSNHPAMSRDIFNWVCLLKCHSTWFCLTTLIIIKKKNPRIQWKYSLSLKPLSLVLSLQALVKCFLFTILVNLLLILKVHSVISPEFSLPPVK